MLTHVCLYMYVLFNFSYLQLLPISVCLFCDCVCPTEEKVFYAMCGR